jgi:hypothetical protein
MLHIVYWSVDFHRMHTSANNLPLAYKLNCKCYVSRASKRNAQRQERKTAVGLCNIIVAASRVDNGLSRHGQLQNISINNQYMKEVGEGVVLHNVEYQPVPASFIPSTSCCKGATTPQG